MADQSLHFKLVLLGDTAVGKSCLVVRFVRDEFFPFQEPTIGGLEFVWVIMDIAAFLTQTVNVDNVTIKFEIWDTAGQGMAVFCVEWSFRTIPKSCSYVLPWRRCCYRSVRYYEPSRVRETEVIVRSPSTVLRPGWRSCRDAAIRMLWLLLLETSAIWRKTARFLAKRPRSTPWRTVCCSWRRLRRWLWMSARSSSPSAISFRRELRCRRRRTPSWLPLPNRARRRSATVNLFECSVNYVSMALLLLSLLLVDRKNRIFVTTNTAVQFLQRFADWWLSSMILIIIVVFVVVVAVVFDSSSSEQTSPWSSAPPGTLSTSSACPRVAVDSNTSRRSFPG